MQNPEEEEESTMSMSMSMSKTTMKNILPHDVVVNILSRLPVKSLLRFRCVSKPWKIFFSDPSFIKRHLKQYSINNYEHLMLTSSLYYYSPDNNDACFYSIAAANHSSSSESSLADEAVGIDFPFRTYGYRAEILGSCNGLLLIEPYENIYCIWNPSTNEFKKLSDTPIEFPKKDDSRVVVYRSTMIFGFGYDKIIEDYKVVRIVRFDFGAHTEVKVYILGSDSWSRIRDAPKYFACQTSPVGKLVGGKFVNGTVHWVGHKSGTPYYKDNEDVSPLTILSFNIEDEQYREIELPNYTDGNRFYMKVELLGGCLCTVSRYDTRFDVWVMRDYGVKESWIKQFTIADTIFSRNFKCVDVKPLKVTKNGELLLFFAQGNNTSLVVYNPKHGTAKTLNIHGMKGYFETHTFVESLISGTFVGQEQAAWRTTLENQKKKRKRPRGWWKDGL